MHRHRPICVYCRPLSLHVRPLLSSAIRIHSLHPNFLTEVLLIRFHLESHSTINRTTDSFQASPMQVRNCQLMKKKQKKTVATAADKMHLQVLHSGWVVHNRYFGPLVVKLKVQCGGGLRAGDGNYASGLVRCTEFSFCDHASCRPRRAA